MPDLLRSGKPRLHYSLDDYTDPWKNAPDLVLQHGNGRSSRLWCSRVPSLSRYYKMVGPDARGLGSSASDLDLVSDVTVDTLVDDLAGIWDALGARTVHFCGESMGGILGLAFA